MKKDWRHTIATIAEVLEGALGAVMLIGCIICGVGLVYLTDVQLLFHSPQELQSRISDMYIILIGVELIKMITSHTVNSVVDVMLVAIARQMIIEHMSPLENVLTVTAVALLFVIRKFLYISHLDNKKSYKEGKTDHSHNATESESAAARTHESIPR